MQKRLPGIGLLMTLSVLIGCAISPIEYADPLSERHNNIATAVKDCSNLLAMDARASGLSLDSDEIRLISWNVQKSRHHDSQRDLATMAGDKDLILLQEAIAGDPYMARDPRSHHLSFSPGYESGGRLSGVLTMSASEPLSRCNLANNEPWFGTPKATSITEYSLSDTDDTLVVVNIHAINFTFGVGHFRQQIEQVAIALKAHTGPLIVSGDFNTWRRKRVEVVARMTAQLGLHQVTFNDDRRKLFFGYALDHIFVRGLRQQKASTIDVKTSDHNPLIVTLSSIQERT